MLSMMLGKLTAIVLLVCSMLLLYYVNKYSVLEPNKTKKTQNNKNCDNIKILHGSIEEPDELRDRVINELSRQKLVFSKKENTWLRRRQID
tara:strand:+ start:1704 stop:1976 length:273 start_codon:yes stop_codon:yes gene_type:complete